MAAVLLLVHRPKGAGVGQPQDVDPDLVHPGPPVRQAGAYRAQEGAAFSEGDAQSRATGDWNLVVLADVVIRVHLHLGVGGVVGVECTGR